MYTPVLAATITRKGTNHNETVNVMKINYIVENNVLWITDHKNCIMDFCLNEFDVEIKSINESKLLNG